VAFFVSAMNMRSISLISILVVAAATNLGCGSSTGSRDGGISGNGNIRALTD